MDYDRCVGHYTRGKRAGQRCTNKGTLLLFISNSQKLKVCATHYNYDSRFSSPWLKEIVIRNILGRYSHA